MTILQTNKVHIYFSGGKDDNHWHKTTLLIKLGVIDLEILHLGIKGDGNFNEKDIENSELKRLGVGRILDSLASLKDRKLIDLNNDGSFSTTDLAKHTLWDEQVPTWVKILRLLEIKSYSIEQISDFLKKSDIEIIDEIEKLRKNQLVLMSPLRQESKIIKMYEILPEGIEKIKKIEETGFKNELLDESDKPKTEILELIDHIIKEICEPEFNKKDLILKLNQIKEKLKI